MIKNLTALLLLIWSMIAPAGTAAAEPVFPPALRVGLEPPGSMTVSKRFAGFEDAERKAAITILDLPARAYPDLERSAFATRPDEKLQRVKREAFPFENGIGVLISTVGKEGGVTVHKWFLLASATGQRPQDLATLISVQVPAAALNVYSEKAIRKALASVTFRPMPIAEQLAMLPFEITNMADFKVVGVQPEGAVILAEAPGSDIGGQSHLIVSIGPGAPTDANDRGRFANDLMASAPIANLRIVGSETMRIGGSPGHELRAQGEVPGAGAVSVVQWVRFGGSGFLRIIGVTRKDDWDSAFPRFRAVRDGITFR
jgi:hypothetical protein